MFAESSFAEQLSGSSFHPQAARMLAGALLDAEAKLGELLKAILDLKGRDLPGKANRGEETSKP